MASLFTVALKGSNIASASTITIPTDGDRFDVSGTTGISEIQTTGRDTGARFYLSFAGAVTLTHGDGLALRDGSDYTTTAGDVLQFEVTGPDEVRQLVLANGGGGDALSIQGVPVSETPPSDGQVLMYDAENEEFVAANAPAGELAVPATVPSSLSGGLANVSSTVANAPAVVIGTKIYVFGGAPHFFGGGILSSIKIYGTETDTWSAASSTLPGPRHSAAAATFEGMAYIFGGWTGSAATDTIWRYVPDTDSIEIMDATLPDLRFAMTAVTSDDGKIYLFAGRDGGNSQVNTIWKYDPVLDVLSTMTATMPSNTSYNCGVLAENGSIYLVSGATVYKYNPSTDTISTLGETLSASRTGAVAARVGDYIYVIAGASTTVELIDPETDSLSALLDPAPSGDRYCFFAGVGNRVFYGGGSPDGSNVTNTMFYLDPGGPFSPGSDGTVSGIERLNLMRLMSPSAATGIDGSIIGVIGILGSDGSIVGELPVYEPGSLT